MFQDPRDQLPGEQLSQLHQAFELMLVGCLEEAAQGRHGLFGSLATEEPWPEAERLRSLALSMQQILAQADELNPLCDEFLDLCSIHGESNPGERKLALAFLKRIEAGQVGQQGEEHKPW